MGDDLDDGLLLDEHLIAQSDAPGPAGAPPRNAPLRNAPPPRKPTAPWRGDVPGRG